MKKILFLLLFTCQSCFASTLLDDLSIEDLLNLEIDTGTKTPIALSKSPSAVKVIPYQQIKKSGARTIPDLLRLVAGVNVRWNAMMQTIDIRGFGNQPFSSRVLLLIDGIPFNSWNKGGFPQQPGFDFFPLENVARIELIKGSSSSVYGGNAYWGVINIKSLSGSDLEKSEIAVQAGSRDTRALTGQVGKSLSEDSSIFVSAKFQSTQLPTEYWFEEADSKASVRDIFVKYEIADWAFSYYWHDDSLDGFRDPRATFIGPYEWVTAEEIEQTINIVSAQYDSSFDNDNLRVAADFGYAERDGHHCAGCHATNTADYQNGASVYADFDGTTTHDHGFQAVADVLAEFNYLQNHTIIVGAEVQRKDSGDSIIEPANDSIDQVRSYTQKAVYIEDQSRFLNDRLTFVAGVRHDFEVDDLFDSKNSPRVAATFEIKEGMQFRIGWNRAFRDPSFVELYQNIPFINAFQTDGTTDTYTGLFAFTPNPDLEDEEITSIDIGLTYLISPEWLLTVDLFRSEVDNFIVREGPSSFSNHPDQANITGLEAELKWYISRQFEGFVNVAFQRNRQDSSVSEIPGAEEDGFNDFAFNYSPKRKLNSGVMFGPYDNGFSGAFELSWRDERVNRGFAGTTILDSYYTANLSLRYDLKSLIRNPDQGLLVRLDITNLNDDEEIIETNNTDGTLAGREAFLSLEYSF